MFKTFYQEALDFHNKLLTNHKYTINLIATLRFITFIACVITFILGFEHTYLFIVSFITLILFLILIYIHNIYLYKSAYSNAIINKSLTFIDRLDDTWMNIEPSQVKFKDNYLCKDLDITGNKSLFLYLNQCHSKAGLSKLHHALSIGLKDVESIKQRNQAVNELALNKDLYLDLSALTSMYDSRSNLDYLISDNYLDTNKLTLYKVLRVFMPTIFFGSIILGLFQPIAFSVTIISFILNILISLVNISFNRTFVSDLIVKDDNIKVLNDVIASFENQSFHSTLLQSYQQRINQKQNATVTLKSLKRLKEIAESSKNGGVYILLLGMIGFDYQLVVAYDKWQKNQGQILKEIIDVYSDIELLLSLGVITQTKENSISPNITDKNIPYLHTKDIHHPLINHDRSIGNNINVDKGILVITGSNMSGKTTFIRTLGINLVLAYAGANVLAKSFEASIMKLLTSIRIEDDYALGISTFYAEINRIKEMVDYSKSNQPMIAFIDEIFMGTNSADRIYGATKALENLASYNSAIVVTTHDFELTKLDHVKNMHFKEYYENKHIKFDYKILPGPSTTRNARYLLEMAGIDS